MNRCHTTLPVAPLRRRLLRLVWALPLSGLAYVAPSQANAQVNLRPFPPAAERGVLQVIAPPVIQMNGKAERLSPGARIRGLNNLVLMSGSIIGQNLLVNFVRNATGEVHDVWVLTEAEAAQTLPTQH
jgi:hypothetical protein